MWAFIYLMTESPAVICTLTDPNNVAQCISSPVKLPMTARNSSFRAWHCEE